MTTGACPPPAPTWPYYMLVRGGVPETRFEKIEGYADHSLKNAGDPEAPENRRIEILIREMPT